MSRIVYTEKELTDILLKLASGDPPSTYSDSYPYNLLYWSGKRWYADCVNLYKALFNGRNINNPVSGSYQQDLSNTGDVTEWGLLKQCTDISQDFTKLGDKFRCLYKDGHFGGYLGFEVYIEGQGTINCVESTPRWEDGIQYSYVDKKGGRRWTKEEESVYGYWTHHGLATKWIKYEDKTEIHKPMNKDVFIKFLPTLEKGASNDFVTLLQKCLAYTNDYHDVIDNYFGDKTDMAVKEYQTRNGLYVDGVVGAVTWGDIIK